MRGIVWGVWFRRVVFLGRAETRVWFICSGLGRWVMFAQPPAGAGGIAFVSGLPLGLFGTNTSLPEGGLGPAGLFKEDARAIFLVSRAMNFGVADEG